MIIASAGHVDHGKTSLIKALTGVDADRLPEEKRRGLTIDLGFAYDRTISPGKTIGFVDVPGHERFVHNMLAGVTAIQAAMLVVAADDGPMPQTREHLDILDLVGVRTGFVVLSKIDLVSSERLRAAEKEVRDLLRGSSLEGAPIFPASVATGKGIPAIIGHLAALASSEGAISPAGWFRLAVDRAFHVEGAGTVVTGLVHSGQISAGENVVVAPTRQTARIRALRVQDNPAQAAQAGDRCALNLAGSGLHKSDFHRGDWIVAPAAAFTTRRIDLSMRTIAHRDRPIRHWTAVHAHIGTGDVTGRIALLEGKELAPGQSGLAQLVLDQPVHALAGDIVILRDQSARETIAGGSVIDPFSPPRGRARPQRLAWLHAASGPDRRAALDRILKISENGVAMAPLAAAWNLADGAGSLMRDQPDAVWCGAGESLAGIAKEHWERLKAEMLAAVDQWHRDHPDGGGINRQALARALPVRPLSAVFDHAIAALAESGELALSGPLVLRPSHRARLTNADEKLWQRLRPLMEADDGKPPTVFELSEALGMSKAETFRVLGRIAKVGLALRVSENRYMTKKQLRALAELAEKGASGAPDGRFAAAAFRDWSGLGRNLTIELLEYFDRAGLTRRIGNEREIRNPAATVFPGADTEM